MKKSVKALLLSLIATLAIGSFAACDNKKKPEESITSESVESDIIISLSSVESVTRFESKQLTPTVKGTQQKPTWTSSAPAVATVDENGLVSALTLGETVITASIGNVSASCTVTVTETDLIHEVEVSLKEASTFVGKQTEEITVDVSYKNEIIEGDFAYTWSLVEGEADVVSIETSENGKSAVFTGLKEGTVTYEIYTIARGYEAYKEITITVKGDIYSLGVSHKDIFAVESGYAVGLTLGDEATDSVTFGDAYLVLNGAKQDEAVNVTWTSNNDNITFESGKITAVKAGMSELTGTATYNEKSLEVKLIVTIEKGYAMIDDTAIMETAATKTFTVPASVEKGNVEKIYFGKNVVFDKTAGKGSISGNVVTFDAAGFPAKDEELGEGQEMTIETNLIVYTMSVDLYTMIINNVAELDQWQAIAAENAVRAGLCVEQQKGIAYNGYFILGDDIEYNKAWKPYKKYGDLWALCYNNPSIWQKVNGVDQLIPGAFQEDWGAGRSGGFKGTFDGKGHYINGMSTAGNGEYNAFIVTLGSGTVRNVAFTNVTIGQACNTVVDRGSGLIENVFIEVNKIESGVKDDTRSWGLIRNSNSPKHTVNNTIVDYTDADLSNLEYVYLGGDITSEVFTGVYLIGVPDDFKGGIWNNAGVSRHQIGSFATPAAMLADSNAASLIKGWSKDMWFISENFVLPNSVMATLTGDFNIVAAEKRVSIGDTMVVSTDKAPQYMVYTLKAPVKGVSIEGNVIKVVEGATAGASFTVVVKSMLDNTTKEMTFTVAPPIVVLEDTMTIEVIATETVTLPESVKGTVQKVMIGSCVLYDSEAGIGELKGNAITPENLPVLAADLGKGVQMTVATSEATYFMYIDVYTMIINNKAEFDSWQAVAADNSVKAGLVIEEQKLAYLTGYFILGDNIEYNNIFKPIVPHAGATPSLYTLCNQTNNNVKGWINQYGANKVIAVNGWTDPKVLGFHGTLDGNGYYINGLRTDGLYSGITVISGTNAVWKNLVFTNAHIGAKSGFLFNRGGGTIENVYVELATVGSGTTNDWTVVYGMTGYTANKVSNLLIDASRIDFSKLTGVYLADLYAASANGAYVIGATGLNESMNNEDKVTKAKAAFYFLATNDIAGSFATAADLLADEKHGAVVKAWAGDFWTVDEVNNKVIPTVLTKTTPVYLEPRDYYLYTNTGKPLDFYLGDITSLGFAENTAVFSFGIPNDGWSDRIEIRVPDTTADYFTFDFVISSEGTKAASLCIWPRVGTQGHGNYSFDGNGLSSKDGADVRTMVILDKNGNDVSKGPWNTDTVYTMKIYVKGEQYTIDNINFATFDKATKFFIANVKAGNDA